MRSGYSIDVLNTSNSPSCAHGPALLFEEFRDSEVKRFYACSAFRDRKECPFYQLYDCKKKNSEVTKDGRFTVIPHKEECKNRLETYRQLSDADRAMCEECGLLLLPQDHKDHAKHTVVSPVTLASLEEPTKLFVTISKSKSFSQYLFTDKTVRFIVDTLKGLGLCRFLCVGTPRIHEHVKKLRHRHDTSVDSLLLDLDKRYQQAWPSGDFSHYNLFNHHFFDPSDREAYESFMVDGASPPVVILDPPFGGLVDPIASTLQKISKLCDSEVKIVWFFPYFLESRMCQACPSLAMLDYMVDYENHNLFQSGGRKHGSPVRIFTNITPASVVLPRELGYWYCEPCQTYRHSQNWHCVDCGSCTSKDGSRYVHCGVCTRCVKPSRVHCDRCNQCVTQDHKCGHTPGLGCHVCGEMSHKRRDCPIRVAPSNKRRKTSDVTTGSVKRGKRKKSL